MDGIKSIHRDILSIQIRSLIIFEFLKEYNLLEKLIREVFEENISNLPPAILQKLYFYNGGRIATYIDFEEDSLKLNVVKYKNDDKFKELKINQIIKIFKGNSCLKEFDFTVPSMQRTTVNFHFYDCILRLLNMRNKLAHEMVHLQFSDKDLIELLNFVQFEKESLEILQNFNVGIMDDVTQYIASNLLYMRRISKKLNEFMVLK